MTDDRQSFLPGDSKAEAAAAFVPPSTVEDPKDDLGMSDYLRKFV